jgi:hypothetical protein
MHRAVEISKIIGLTKSLVESNTSEFVVHCQGERDLRFRSPSRDAIFKSLKVSYLALKKDSLPVYGIAKGKTLADFCTTESDVSRGISRKPMQLARLFNEDKEKEEEEAVKK